MPKVTIDGTEYEVQPGRNMLQAALDNGLDLPYFCWHPAMGSVGACRLCAVRVYKDANDTRGKIQMACMTPAEDGTRMSMNDPEATEFRRCVIEWLMINHPHDCPVCDEGGECHLQDMTAMCGQVYRRYRFRKRTYSNQYLGPFVNHEMNRCIQCYRCVRFYRDHAGGRDLDVFASKNHLYFGRDEDGLLESEFSGNLVEVCPTGVFTDKTLQRHYTRKWDMETAPSVCVHCGLGCNTIPGARYGTMRRVTARYNSEVNGYFLCDRGRFGYEFADCRLTIDDCRLEGVAEAIARAKGVVGIGSPRASLESNYALRKLVGKERFSTGLSGFEQEGAELALSVMGEDALHVPSLAEIEGADAVLILGADPTGEAPMLDFAIRQAMKNAPLDAVRRLNVPTWDATCVANILQDALGKLITVTPWPIKLEEIASEVVHAAPPEIAAFDVPDRLRKARQPLVVTSVSAGADVVRRAVEIARSLSSRETSASGQRASSKHSYTPWLSLIVPEANTMGVAMMGGMPVEEALGKIESGEADTLVVLENDLMRRANPELVERALAKVKNFVVLDCVPTPTSERTSMAVPTANYFESDGTFVSAECRAQRFFQVHESKHRPAWSVFGELAGCEGWSSFEDVLRDLADELPVFAPALEAGPPADWRSPAGQKVPRMPHRFSGRTAIYANVSVSECEPPSDPETPFAFTMEGDQNVAPGPLVTRYWYPGWNSNAALNKFQIEVGGELRGGNPGRLLDVSGHPCPDTPEHLIDAVSGQGCPETSDPCPETKQIPRFARNDYADNLWMVPKPYIFGSEELSRMAEGIAEVIPVAEMVMHPETAQRLGVQLSDASVSRLKSRNTVTLDVDGVSVSLPAQLDESMAADVIGVSAGFPETMGILGPTPRVSVKSE